MSSARRAQIVSGLRDVVLDLSGYEPDDLDDQATFLEHGFDSLFLTQLAAAFQKAYGVKVTFRQLFDELPTLQALAGHIDESLPADAAVASPEPPAAVTAASTESAPAVELPQAAPVPTPLPSISNVATNRPALQALLTHQLDLMRQQLELLGGARGQPKAVQASPVDEPTTKAEEVTEELLAGGPPPTAIPFGPLRPQAGAKDDGITDAQQRHIDALVARYNAKTPGSKASADQYRAVHADPRTATGFKLLWKEMIYPIVVVRSEGPRLWDVDGNEYVDMLNGFGPNFLGHMPPFLKEALHAQIDAGIEVGPMPPLAGEAAALVCEFTGMDRATFVNTGSEAVQAAIRVARTVTGRDKVVVFHKDYHGNFDEVLVRQVKAKGIPRTFPLAPGIPRSAVENVLVLDYGTDESLEIIRQHAHELAAVVIEPMQSRRPEFVPREFIQQVRRITEEAGALFVFDEVITGFRSHPGGAQAIYGVEADLATYGKVLASGIPIGVVAGRARFMDTFDGGAWQFGDDSYPSAGVTFFAGTFVRHPLAIAAVHATLCHLKEQGPELQERLNEKTTAYCERLNGLFRDNDIAIRVPHFASQMFIRDEHPADLSTLLWYHLREKGVHILENFPSYMTVSHTQEDLDFVFGAFEESVAEMQDGGIFRVPEKKLQAATNGESMAATRFRLTAQQSDIWVASQMSDEASCAYNESDTVDLRGPMNLELLSDAVRRVLSRHQALHVRFEPGGEFQEVHAASQIEVGVVDLTAAGEERRAKLAEVLAVEASTPFDLECGPLFRVKIIRLTEEHHRLVLWAHHIVIDGWSSGVLLHEVAATYSAFCQGIPAPLPAATPFSAYALELEEFARSRDAKDTLAWWLQHHAGGALESSLPTDRPRPADKSYAGGTVKWQLSDDVYKAVKKAAGKMNTSLFSLLLGAYEVLLARLSNADEVTVGVSVAGQAQSGADALVGHCVNLLPVRGLVDPNVSAREHLLGTKRRLLDAQEHQQVSLGEIIRGLDLPRTASRLPLVEVMFNFSIDRLGLDFYGLDAQLEENPRRASHMDLFANVLETPSGLTADWDYNTDLFDEATVRRWVGHYETLLRQIASEPDTAVGKLPLLSDDERDQVVREWNSTTTEPPSAATIFEMIREQAEREPARVAVVCGDQSLTHGELQRDVNRLAHHLRDAGIGPGTLCGVCVNRSVDMLVALLAVLSAGGAYVPLDPEYPSARLATILEEAHPAVVITQRAVAESLPRHDGRTLVLDDERERIAARDSAPLATSASSHDVAYVIFTSGSTGKPKGVMVPHRAAVNFLASMSSRPGMVADDVLVAVTTPSFDISVLELFLPLVVGAKTVIANADEAADGLALGRLLEKAGATVFQATPSTYRLLFEDGFHRGSGIRALCGGEALPPDLAARLVQTFREVWNMYGPTETTVWSTCHSVRYADGPILIGTPIQNTQVHVLDPRGELCPVGVAGELLIGGAGVARGYWQQPELTNARFVDPPLSLGTPLASGPAGSVAPKLYRTGDLVRWRPDGNLEHLRRSDDQVKVRGFRIELGDVETALMTVPTVRAAVAAVREQSPGDVRLWAFLVPRSADSPPEVAEVRKHLRGLLPEYMIPQRMELITEIPRTPNGKVDRRRLPFEDVVSSLSQEVHEPETDTERFLATLWTELLGVERVGRDDNFFDLGGHSLLSIRAIGRIKDATGVRISPRLVLLDTLSQVADAVDASRGPDAPKMNPGLDDTPRRAPCDEPLPPSLYSRLFKKMQQKLVR